MNLKAQLSCAMDLQLPDMHGRAAITALRRDAPWARVIVLTTYAGEAPAAPAIRAGAVGYMLKSAVRDADRLKKYLARPA